MVLDASGALELLLNTSSGRRLNAAMTERGVTSICAPHFIDLEITNVLRRYVRMRKLSESQAAFKLQRWRRSSVVRYPHTPFLGRIWELRDNLSPYDAAYVALAEALSMTLGTADRGIAGAPGVRAAIEFVPPTTV